MRRALLRGFSLFSTSRIPALSGNPGSRRILYEPPPSLRRIPPQIRFFCSDNGISDLTPQTSVSEAEEKSLDSPDVEDVSNKVFKSQLEKYLHNFDEDALPEIFASVLKRKLSEEHEYTDDEVTEEFRLQPLDNVDDKEFDSDLDDALETDEEIDDLYNAGDIVRKRMASDPYFNMNHEKFTELIRGAMKHGNLNDTRELEETIEDMQDWNKLLPDDVKKRIEKKFHEIGDMVERGELDIEESYPMFKEFEDQIVSELVAQEEQEQEAQQLAECENQELDDPPGEGPVLRWQTRVVFSPGDEQWHPKNRKVKLAVTMKEIGLNKHQFIRLRELAGKRYNPGKDELTITSERFEHREENRKDCLRTLFALIEEAGKARILVEEARKSEVKDRLLANPAFLERLQNAKKVAEQTVVQ